MLKVLFLSFWIFSHPVHVSLMSMDYSSDIEAFNVFLKVYEDDFILDNRLLTGDVRSIDFSGKQESLNETLSKYVNSKVQIFADGKKLTGIIENFESSEGELKMNLVYRNIRKSKSWLVRNNIMTDLHKDQSNLLIFRHGDYEEGVQLTPDKPEKLFILKR